MLFKSWKKRCDENVYYKENRGDDPGFVML